MKLLFTFLIFITISILALWRVEGAVNHKIIAGAVAETRTDVGGANFRLTYPVGGCANPVNGDLYLCDSADTTTKGLNRVFKVDGTTKIVSVYAGNGIESGPSGDGFEAIFAGLQPLTCTCDSNGDLFILDRNKNIRVVNGTTKIISTFVTGTTFNGPNALASDANYIYVADKSNNLIQKVDRVTKTITALAGGGVDTSDNVLATTASLSGPSGVSVGPDGSVYFCDSGNKIVRKITPNGNIVTVAGTMATACAAAKDVCGDGGSAVSATLFSPMFVHVKPDGTVVIADKGRLRSVNPQGVISTLAGTGEDDESYFGGPSGDGQTATAVRIKTMIYSIQSIYGLFGYNDVIYFNDRVNKRYRKVENGILDHAFGGSVLSAGGIPLINAALSNDASITFDSNHNMYLALQTIIFKVENGIVKRFAGGDSGNTENADALKAQFGFINKLKIVADSKDNIYICDGSKNNIKKYDKSTGKISIVVGSSIGASGAWYGLDANGILGTGAMLGTPKTICLDENENVIIGTSHATHGCIYSLYDKTTGFVKKLFGGPCTADTLAAVDITEGCAVDKSTGEIYFSSKNYIKKYKKSTSEYTIVVGSATTCTKTQYDIDQCGEGKSGPEASLGKTTYEIAFHPITNELYWSDYDSDTKTASFIRKLSNGKVVTVLGQALAAIPETDSAYSHGEWSKPLETSFVVNRMSFSPSGQLYFSDASSQGFIRSIDSNNRVITVSGHFDKTGERIYYSGENTTALETALCKPTNIAKKKNSDDLYIALTCFGGVTYGTSTTYSRIAKLDSATGSISTIIGNFKDGASADGLPGLQTSVRPYKVQTGSLYYPFGLQVASNGDVYYADSLNHVIRKMSSDGIVTIIAGTLSSACTDSTSACGDNGDAKSALLNTPTGIFLTESGELYIADTLNHKIRKLKNGQITTVIGSGTSCSSSCNNPDPLLTKLNNPSNIYVTKSGDIYVTDTKSFLIRKLSGSTMSVVAGTGADCYGTDCGHNVSPTSALIKTPVGIFVDESTNDIYISDKTSSIRRISQTQNKIFTYAGTFFSTHFLDSDLEHGVTFSSPTGILQTSTGILVADTDNGKIREISMQCPPGYSGLACEVASYSCFGLQQDNANVCSGNGTCSGPDQCKCHDGFTGEICDMYTCNGVPQNSSSVCSGKGSCITGVCHCVEGFYGGNCNITYCYGVADKDSNVCSQHGSCVSFNNCSCNADWSGQYCNTTLCFGISNFDSKVCSGHGSCIGKDQCSCSSSWSGLDCGVTTCNGIHSNDSSVCNGRGPCVDFNSCKCNSGWLGSYCEETSCFGISDKDSNVCSQHGSCVSLNNCSCSNEWFGESCNSTTCFGINNFDSKVCGGHGSCIGKDQCSCNQSWSGLNCSVTTCNGIHSNDSSVCNGRGPCVDFNSCKCNSGWFGSYCEETSCFGISEKDSNVCGQHGSCINFDTCSCKNEWFGESCNSTTCFGINNFDSKVCGGHGSCIGKDQCSCSSSWSGLNCSVTTCNGIHSNDSSVCNGRGPCVDFNSCKCNSGWFGAYCNETSCNNVAATDSTVCSGHGDCLSLDSCLCHTHYSGSTCNITSCFEVSSTDDSVCSARGLCTSFNTCKCTSGWYGAYCNVTSCFSVESTDSKVCNGHGSCVSPDTCSCSEYYSGSKCEKTSCYGVNSTDSSVCNGHGQCNVHDTCKCNAGWFGAYCNVTSCFSVESTDSKVCNGHGSCTAPDTCSCFEHYSGSKCEITSCYGITSTESSVCNKHGQCNVHDTCVCNAGWFGSYCNLTKCFEKNNYDSQVCNGHGSCTAPDTCSCFEHYSGSKCEITSCYGISSTEISVCNKRGQCNSFDTCVCNAGWFGNECTTTSCFGTWSNVSSVCATHGNCSETDQCTCSSNDWAGSDCSDEVPLINTVDSVVAYVDRVPIYVKQYLTCTQCNLNTTLPLVAIEWKQISGPSVEFSKLSSNDLKISSFSDQTAQKYIFEVSSTFKKVTKKSQVIINTEEPVFSISLYQSDINATHVTVGVEISPQEMSSKLLTSSWTWTCKNSDLVTNCDQSILDYLASVSSKRSTLFTVAAGTTKSIHLSLQIKNTVSNLDVSFPQDETVPIINMLSVSPQNPIITTSDKLTLQLMVSVNGKFDGIESLIQRVWNLNGKALVSPVLTYPTDASKSNIVVLDISKLSEGSLNNLTCTVTTLSSKATSVYTYSFNVAVNPKPCSCSASPSTGYALETSFTLKCTSCEVSSDTQVQFAFTDAKTKLNVPLAKSTSTKLSTPLPYTGSSLLPIQITISNTKTKAKVEQFINVTIEIPKVSTSDDVKKKKTAWDTVYKTLLSNDPRKVVFGYITPTVTAMTESLPKARSIMDGTCLNGGVFNSETNICNCSAGFKKNDCSMTESEWLELVNDRWLTAQLIYEEFNSANGAESQSDSKLAIQSSILYHLMEKYDEISPQQFEQGFEIFKQQIEDTKTTSYITIPVTISDAMSSTLGLLQKSQVSIEGKKSDVFDQVVKSCLTDLGSIKFRDQPVDETVVFESSSYTLTTTKMYPTELSNKMIGDVVKFPDQMSSYLTSYDVRKPLSVRVWKQSVQSNSNQTIQTIDNVEITTTITPVNFALSLDFGSAGQILNIPQENKIISYFFHVSKKVNDSTTSQSVRQGKIKNTIITSEMSCESSCITEQLDVNLFVCKCSQIATVSMSERVVRKVAYVDVQPTVNNNPDYDYLAFLVFIPVVLGIILVPLIIVLVYMRRKKGSSGGNVELKSV